MVLKGGLVMECETCKYSFIDENESTVCECYESYYYADTTDDLDGSCDCYEEREY